MLVNSGWDGSLGVQEPFLCTMHWYLGKSLLTTTNFALEWAQPVGGITSVFGANSISPIPQGRCGGFGYKNSHIFGASSAIT